MLSTVSWIGPATGGAWDVASNWHDSTTNTNHVPGAADDVTIDAGATAATITIRSGDIINIQSLHTASDDTLSFTGGSLTVTSSTVASVLDGPLSMTGGSLTASGSGASFTANGATTVADANLAAKSGGSLALPELNSYVSSVNNSLQADGADSVLELSNLSTATNQSGNLSLAASIGGTIKLQALTDLNNPGGSIYCSITDTGGSTIDDPQLTTLDQWTVTLDGTDATGPASWTQLTRGGLTIDGGSENLAGLTDVGSSNLTVKNGGSLTLSGVTSYASNSNNTLEADGASSMLALPNLTTATNQAVNLTVNATRGGTINVPDLTGLANPADSVYCTVTDTGGSTIIAPQLASVDGYKVTLDGTDAHAADAWTQFSNGTLTITGGSYSLTALTDVDGSGLYVKSGGALALPDLTSYASGYLDGFGNYQGTLFSADGAGSVLDLSALTDVTQNAVWTAVASNDGEVKLPELDTLTGAYGAYINANGGSSTLDLANLTSITGPNLISVSNGATLSLPKLTAGNIILHNGQTMTIQGVAVSLPADGTSGATINAPASQALAITLQNSGNLTGTTFNVGQGTSVTLSGTYLGGTAFNADDNATVGLAGGTYLGGASFNVAQGATVYLNDQGVSTFGGALTGTGSGSVISSGTLLVAQGGVTLNFPGDIFQWTGGGIGTAVGDVTNQGTMNISGSVQKVLYDDGTLFNYGTIVQTGSALFSLHSDNVSPTTFVNEAGASYVIESDSGIGNYGGGTTAVENAGVIRKTAGAGTAYLYVNGSLSNTGTIEADSGVLFINNPGSVSQISGKTLTGGAWKALDGATLEFPNGTNIVTNQATVELGGSGATIAALANLASNSGVFSVTDGATFSAPGDFSNSGSLTLGADSTLSVAGSFTQTSAGAINEQIGGSPASGHFGQAAIVGSAALGGSFNLDLVNSYAPVDGQSYPVLAYGSSTGSFTTITGLPQGMTANQTATEFDLNMPVASSDLVVTSATAPTAATDGQSITINWHVKNQSGVDSSGNWLDAAYLSKTSAITSSSILLGSIAHTGGLTAGATYDGSLNATIPALAPGHYYVLVETDSHFTQADSDRANNTLAATTGQLDVSVPALTLGAPTNGAFTAANQDQYYQVTVPAGGSLVATLASAATSGAAALYVSQGAAPTPFSFQFAATANQPNQTLTVPNASGGAYYILLHSVSGDAATAGHTLTVNQTSALGVSSTSLSSGGNAGNVTVEVNGTNFSPNVTASLNFGATIIAAASIDYVNSSTLFATFDLNGATPGSYAFNVVQDAQSVAAPTPFQIVSASAGALQIDLVTPRFVRSGRTASIVVAYSNKTSNDILAPLLALSSTNADVLFSSPASPSTFAATAQIVATVPKGPAGVIPPGQSGQLTFTLLSHDTVDGDVIPVQLMPTANNTPNLSLDSEGGLSQSSPPPQPPGNYNTQTNYLENHTPIDPNALIGPAGYGAEGFIQPVGAWPYTIEFENEGSVAAQDVTVTEQLDAKLDWSTFQLGSFGFGPVNVAIPAGLTQYQTTVSYQNVDGSSLNVVVALDFNVQTGELTATFTSLDPATGQAPNGVTDGFLPPDDNTHVGEGFVQYTIKPKSGLATGDAVNQQAAVVFDINAPIDTDPALNTIDVGTPASAVAALPAVEHSSSFMVSWSGTDDAGGSGIASYDVFVSDNGGPFAAFQTDTTDTSAVFTGVDGHTYAFYSVAADNVGNVQPAPNAAQATTTVSVITVLPQSSVDPLPSLSTPTFQVSWSGSDAGGPGIAAYDIYVSDNGGPFSAWLTGTTETSAAYQGALGHTYSFYSVAIDQDGARQATPAAAQATTQVLVKDANGMYVVAVYHDVLDRQPDPGGLAYWTNLLDSGAAVSSVAANIAHSDEYYANFVIKPDYMKLLGREADDAGVTHWTQLMRAGLTDQQLEAMLVSSDEFYANAGGTDVAWIDAIYQLLLGRQADSSGEAHWSAQLTAGLTRLQVALQIAGSTENNTQLINDDYFHYLGREADPDGLTYWLAEFASGKTNEDVIAGFTGSQEYYKEHTR